MKSLAELVEDIDALSELEDEELEDAKYEAIIKSIKEEIDKFVAVNDVNSQSHKDEHHGMTLLHAACSVDNLELVHYLINECKANVEIADEMGDTPLITSVKANTYFVSRYFCTERKDINYSACRYSHVLSATWYNTISTF